ncbi:MAG: metallophosphoesterase [Bacteroidia bacterium]
MRWIFIFALWILAEIGGYWGLRRLGVWRPWMGWITPLLLLGMLSTFWIGRWAFLPVDSYKRLQMGLGILFMLWVILILTKLASAVIGIFDSLKSTPSVTFSEGRRATLRTLAGIALSLPSVALGYGFFVGRFRFRVEEVEILLPDLPSAWDGLSILHFSDLHSGSFLSPAPLRPVWQQIKALAPDIIAFTGDWVNTFAREIDPFLEDLATLSAPLGKWAVFGNHDYGDYIAGASLERRLAERKYLKAAIEKAGFRLLHNEAIILEREGQRMAIIGVGNWSQWRRFRRYGDLAQAWAQVPPNTFAILLSHDPTHWEYEVQGKYPIPLTLSGHTHGFQMGLEWRGYRFSPAQWLYTYWAGLYRVGQQYLYVNRGLGYIGLPARLGIWPELTFIRLRRSKESI